MIITGEREETAMGEHNGFFGIYLNFKKTRVFERFRKKGILPAGPPYQIQIMSSE